MAEVPMPSTEQPLHNDSTSSSSVSSPTGGGPDILRSLRVRVFENQRWFPIIGWATSRLPADPPNITPWPARPRDKSPDTPEPFDVLRDAVMERNAIDAGAAVPVFPLQLTLPDGYVWDGYWEMCRQHPKGVDAQGWRYGENFDASAHFKKTQTPTCVVRRRVWQRRVRLARSGPTASSPTASEVQGIPTTEEETAVQLYLQEKQEEMGLAERLKTRRQEALDGGSGWTQDDDLAAEEELRAFIRERRQQYTESATRRRSTNNSFANPFQSGSPIGGDHAVDTIPSSDAAAAAAFSTAQYRGAIAASTWAVDSKMNRARKGREGGEHDDIDVSDDEEFVRGIQHQELTGELQVHGDRGGGTPVDHKQSPYRPDGVLDGTAPALTFQHHHDPASDDGRPDSPPVDLQPQATIERFVAASSDGDGDAEDTSITADGVGDTNDFNAIFSKFMSNPESAHASGGGDS